MVIMILGLRCASNAIYIVRPARWLQPNVHHVTQHKTLDYWVLINVFAKMDIMIMAN